MERERERERPRFAGRYTAAGGSLDVPSGRWKLGGCVGNTGRYNLGVGEEWCGSCRCVIKDDDVGVLGRQVI